MFYVLDHGLKAIPTDAAWELVTMLRYDHTWARMNLYFLSRPDEKIDQDKPNNIFDAWRPSPICDLEEEDNTPIVHTGILDREGIYRALSQEKKEIRLFQLFPGKSEDLIHGDVFVASLNDKTGLSRESCFKSYLAFGTYGNIRHCRMYGEMLTTFVLTWLIKKDCRHSESPAGTKTPPLKNEAQILWIDALCINQSDNKEKMSQIGFMRDIFS